jgi:hypothetical protein
MTVCVSVGRLPPYPPNSRLAKGPEPPLGAFFACDSIAYRGTVGSEVML